MGCQTRRSKAEREHMRHVIGLAVRAGIAVQHAGKALAAERLQQIEDRNERRSRAARCLRGWRVVARGSRPDRAAALRAIRDARAADGEVLYHAMRRRDMAGAEAAGVLDETHRGAAEEIKVVVARTGGEGRRSRAADPLRAWYLTALFNRWRGRIGTNAAAERKGYEVVSYSVDAEGRKRWQHGAVPACSPVAIEQHAWRQLARLGGTAALATAARRAQVMRRAQSSILTAAGMLRWWGGAGDTAAQRAKLWVNLAPSEIEQARQQLRPWLAGAEQNDDGEWSVEAVVDVRSDATGLWAKVVWSGGERWQGCDDWVHESNLSTAALKEARRLGSDKAAPARREKARAKAERAAALAAQEAIRRSASRGFRHSPRLQEMQQVREATGTRAQLTQVVREQSAQSARRAAIRARQKAASAARREAHRHWRQVAEAADSHMEYVDARYVAAGSTDAGAPWRRVGLRMRDQSGARMSSYAVTCNRCQSTVRGMLRTVCGACWAVTHYEWHELRETVQEVGESTEAAQREERELQRLERRDRASSAERDTNSCIAHGTPRNDEDRAADTAVAGEKAALRSARWAIAPGGGTRTGRMLAEAGLQRVAVPGDGSCLYWALRVTCARSQDDTGEDARLLALQCDCGASGCRCRSPFCGCGETTVAAPCAECGVTHCSRCRQCDAGTDAAYWRAACLSFRRAVVAWLCREQQRGLLQSNRAVYTSEGQLRREAVRRYLNASEWSSDEHLAAAARCFHRDIAVLDDSVESSELRVYRQHGEELMEICEWTDVLCQVRTEATVLIWHNGVGHFEATGPKA